MVIYMNYEDDDEDKKKRRDPFRDIFGIPDIDKEFERMQRLMDEMMTRGFSRQDKDPFVYGFSVRTGPNGKPKIQEFGNAKDYFLHKQDESEKSEWTPLTDVQEVDDKVMVTIDIPGVEKEDIDIEVKDSKMVLNVDGKRRYKTTIDLPCMVDVNDSEASYNNGVLEVKLKKKQESHGKSIEIN